MIDPAGRTELYGEARWMELAGRLGMDRTCGAASAEEGGNALGGGPCLRRVAVWKDCAGGAAAL